MQFETVKFEHIGATAEDGVTLLDEINHAMQECARLMGDGLHANKAKIAITVEMLSQGDRESGHWSVMIAPKVQVTQPTRERTATVAFMNIDGELVTQKAEQLPMFPSRNRVERDEAKRTATREAVEAELGANE